MHSNTDLDVVRNIAIIEKLKCGVLSQVSALFESMSAHASQEDRKEILAQLLIDSYLLSEKLGIDFEALEWEAAARLRAAAASEDRLAAEKKQLLHHLRKTRDEGL